MSKAINKTAMQMMADWLEGISADFSEVPISSALEYVKELLVVEKNQIEYDTMAQFLKEHPVKFCKVALFIMGKDIYKSNATDFTLSEEADMEEGKRFEIKLVGTIRPVNK